MSEGIADEEDDGFEDEEDIVKSPETLATQLEKWGCKLEQLPWGGEEYEINWTKTTDDDDDELMLVHFKIFDVPESELGPQGEEGTADFKPFGKVLYIYDFFSAFEPVNMRITSISLRAAFKRENQNMANYFMSWIFEFAAVKKVDYVLLFSAWTGFSKKENRAISDFNLFGTIEPERAKALVAEMVQRSSFRTADGSTLNGSQALQRIEELMPLVQKNGFYGKYGFIRVNKKVNFEGEEEWPKITPRLSYTHYADMRTRHPLILKAPFVDLAR